MEKGQSRGTRGGLRPGGAGGRGQACHQDLQGRLRRGRLDVKGEGRKQMGLRLGSWTDFKQESDWAPSRPRSQQTELS